MATPAAVAHVLAILQRHGIRELVYNGGQVGGGAARRLQRGPPTFAVQQQGRPASRRAR
jgi:hypothetical protein